MQNILKDTTPAIEEAMADGRLLTADTKELIATLADAYLRHSGKASSSLGLVAVKDGRFFLKLADAESSLTTRKFDEMVNWLVRNWPAGKPWPKDVAGMCEARREALGGPTGLAGLPKAEPPRPARRPRRSRPKEQKTARAPKQPGSTTDLAIAAYCGDHGIARTAATFGMSPRTVSRVLARIRNGEQHGKVRSIEKHTAARPRRGRPPGRKARAGHRAAAE
jgi:hypothetical protein